MTAGSLDSGPDQPSSLGIAEFGRPSGTFVPPAVERSDLQSRVRSQLRLAILSGQLKPGERVHQATLARAFGVSTSPLREAIRDLVAVGLLDVETYAGASVHIPTLEELEVICEMRVALMPITVRHAVANITDAELERAAHLVDLLSVPMPKVEWVELNREFHSLLDGACRVATLSDSMRRLDDLMTLYVNLDPMSGNHTEYRQRRNTEHVAIIAAYVERDVELATQLNIEHVQRTVSNARLAIAGERIGSDS